MEWRSIYILSGELLETVNRLGFQVPLPFIAGEFAASAVMVLTNPLHKLYGKINLFLQKAPSWEIGKIPSYWIDKILLHEPDYDDGYFEEINWLLDVFVKGLRTPNVGRSIPDRLRSRTDIVAGYGDLPSCERLRTCPLALQLPNTRANHQEEDFASYLPRNAGRRKFDLDHESRGRQLD